MASVTRFKTKYAGVFYIEGVSANRKAKKRYSIFVIAETEK
jgi:hypothetical protein